MNIKGMDKDMKCRGFQFEIGKEYKIDTNKSLKLCSDNVFHYCKSLRNVHCYYDCDSNNRFFEIEVLGEEITDGEKYGSNHIKIIREIKGEELDMLKGHINKNTGLFNTGNANSGHYNSGSKNSGNRNSGSYNSGDENSGVHNSGCVNSGARNSGNFNTGDCNNGTKNSGYYNNGNNNSGIYNNGNYNTGVANCCDNSNGVFCNVEDKNIRIFNKPSGMSLSDFYNSRYYDALLSVSFRLTEWVEYTNEEKKESKEKELIGGYLKTYSYKEAWNNWWNKLSDENKEIIMDIPNFDKNVFEDITGIKIDNK